MCDADLQAMARYKRNIYNAAQRTGTDPAVLAGIMSRESNGGRTLDANGLGDHGNGFGLMQVDKRWHTPAGGPYSEEHIVQGASILRDFTNQISTQHPDWSGAEKQRAGIAAYNAGVNAVQDRHNPDARTYQGNYSSDVLQRTEFFRRHGYN